MQDQSAIQLLSDQVINKIAAGEVVERPASVMKELFENALDAGASHIAVEIVRGGRQLIAVTDNGCGMTRDQALLSIERHATSKIRSEADIERIHTLGFRGEALAAISSVSRLTLISRTADEHAGTELRIAGGKLLGCEETGCPKGTRLEVRNLFYNVPARRKFLRAEQTELSHIRQLFLIHALAHPDIGMSLKIDGRATYNLPADGQLEDRISELYSPGFFRQLASIKYSDGLHIIQGYAGLPQTGRKDRQDQHIFVNGRPAAAPVVYHAINEAYHPLIDRGRYPAVFLFLGMDPSLVDVNVHPTKKEVRFRQPNQLRDAIVAAVQGAVTFGGEGRRPDLEALKSADEGRAPLPTSVRPQFQIQKQMDDLLVRPNQIELAASRQQTGGNQTTARSSAEGMAVPDIHAPARAERTSTTSPWNWCRIIGRIGEHFVVLETEDGFVLMEPRAAHERVLFEKFMRAVQQQAVQKQGLLTPETIALLPEDAQTVCDNIAEIRKLGFGISEFGGDTFIIDALPIYVQEGPIESILTEMVTALDKTGSSRTKRTLVQEQMVKSVCRTAVRAKERLSEKEIEGLVADLAETEMPYTSPRGQPTLIFTSFAELNRKFNLNP